MLAATYEISLALSVLFSRGTRVNSYLTPLWTVIGQHPHKLQCRDLAMHIGAAIYRMCAKVITSTAFNVLRNLSLT